jgi:acetolactate synthase small subunit
MADFAKRIRKILKKPKNALVLGNALGHLEKISETFSSVFVINGEFGTIRKKNIIYRENFENLENIAEIDFVFIDKNRIDDLYELRNFLRRNQPYVLTEAHEAIKKEHTKFFRGFQYQVVDINKKFYIWKNKSK